MEAEKPNPRNALWPEVEVDEREDRYSRPPIDLPSGPGDEFFAELEPGAEVTVEVAMALRAFRRTLARLRSPHVIPAHTSGEKDDYCELLLKIPHSGDPSFEISISFGDSLGMIWWPHGKLVGIDDTEFILKAVAILEGLLLGRNRQVITLRCGRRVHSAIEIYAEDGSAAYRCENGRLRTVPLRVLPLPTERVVERISFERSPARLPRS